MRAYLLQGRRAPPPCCLCPLPSLPLLAGRGGESVIPTLAFARVRLLLHVFDTSQFALVASCREGERGNAEAASGKTEGWTASLPVKGSLCTPGPSTCPALQQQPLRLRPAQHAWGENIGMWGTGGGGCYGSRVMVRPVAATATSFLCSSSAAS